MVQMPALNTPQFGWVKSRLPRKALPVPPIFDPRVAAEAIVFAAWHRRREMLVAMPTLKAVFGNRLVPALLDRYLARTGYQAQQTGQPEDPNRADNLWKPLDDAEDRGADGTFSSKAKPSSWCLQLQKRRHILLPALGLAVLGSGVVAGLASRSRG